MIGLLVTRKRLVHLALQPCNSGEFAFDLGRVAFHGHGRFEFPLSLCLRSRVRRRQFENGFCQFKVQPWQSRIDLQRFSVVLDRALEVSSVHQVLGDHLLHARGAGSKDGQLVHGVVGQLRIDTLRHEQNIYVVRIEIHERVHYCGSRAEISFLLVEAG